MITRIVRLTLKDELSLDEFKKLYTKRNPKSRGVSGCLEVRIMKDIKENNIYYTVSKWSNNQALEDYRSSEYFKQTWPMVKSTLAARTKVFTMEDIVDK